MVTLYLVPSKRTEWPSIWYSVPVSTYQGWKKAAGRRDILPVCWAVPVTSSLERQSEVQDNVLEVITKIDSAEDQDHTSRHWDDFQLGPELDLVLGGRFLPEDVGDGVGVEVLGNLLPECGEESEERAMRSILSRSEVVLFSSGLKDPSCLLLLTIKQSGVATFYFLTRYNGIS